MHDQKQLSHERIYSFSCSPYECIHLSCYKTKLSPPPPPHFQLHLQIFISFFSLHINTTTQILMMKILTVMTLLFLLSFSSSLFLLSHATTSDTETESTMRVLLEVKSSVSEDPQNVLSDWSRNNTDYCSWKGVSCGLKSLNDSVQVVVGLNLSNSLLTGSISPSLAHLQNLLHLDLSNNRLIGPIPPTLSNLTSLESLRLFSNPLTGPIPSELSSLLNLQVLRIGNNRLTGVIFFIMFLRTRR